MLPLKASNLLKINNIFLKSTCVPPWICQYRTCSNGIVALGPKRKWEIIKKVKEFNDFDFKNNPYGERDFGAFADGNEQIFWKIDYYDKNLEFASENPSNPEITNRVLTIYLASEH